MDKDLPSGPPSPELLARLISETAAGNRKSVETLYIATSAKLYAILVILLKDRASAEDVLQDVYVTIWQRSITYDRTRSHPMAWLVTIARNKAIDRLRSDQNLRNLTVSSAKLIEPIDQTPSVLDAIERNEMLSTLNVCMEGLTVKQKSMINAAFFEGLTYEAIAERERAPIGTVKSSIRRGLVTLRLCLDGRNDATER